ncbi:MAG: hypothetical protein JWR80_2069 [Bradyrhizobium sp.]|nr:hypothetical protein [Bradyrhizobium sp.]
MGYAMHMDRADLDILLLKPKRAHNWTGFQKRENQANYLIGLAQLSDLDDVFMPGLTLEIEVKSPVLVERCLVMFTLRKRMGALRPRLYQLEVCPSDKRSHNGDPVIYGPHEHFLEDEVHAVTEISVNCDDWDGAVDWFLKRINVHKFKVERPW